MVSEYFSDVSFAPAMAFSSDATEQDLCSYGAAVVSNPKREGTAATRGGALLACWPVLPNSWWLVVLAYMPYTEAM